MKFTLRLAVIYDHLKNKKETFEIVFVSVDRDGMDYLECYIPMPFLAFPYGDGAPKSLLKYFSIHGIPRLVIISPDGKTVIK